MTTTTARIPEKLVEIIEDFQSVPDPERLELLLEFSDELPELPERYAGHLDQMEQVVECQTPLFLAVEMEQPEQPEEKSDAGPAGSSADSSAGAGSAGAGSAGAGSAGAGSAGAGSEPLIRLFVSAPPEAPTSRGFASVLAQSLDGLPASEVLAVPEDISTRLGLQKALTPLRLRGMSAMLGRIKRNVAAQLATS